MSHPLGISSSTRSIIFPCLLLLIYLVHSSTAVHCYQHSSTDKSKSPLMNTCMTTRQGFCIYKEMNGRIERNCDGNGVQQISVCNELVDTKKTVVFRDQPTVFDHRGFSSDGSGRRISGCISSSGFGCGKGSDSTRLKSLSPNGPNDDRDQYNKGGRVRPSDPSFSATDRTARFSPQCFDMGQLGTLCCCQGEKCNSASSLSILLLLLSILPRL